MDPRLRTWRARIFVSTWLCYAGFYFCRKPYSAAKSSLGADLSLSTTTLGTIGASYLVAYTIGQFAAAGLGQKSGPRVMLLAGMGTAVLTHLALGFSTSLAALIGFVVVNGLAQGTGWSGTVGTMASWFRRRERGTVMGFWATNYQVGGIAATALAGFVVVRWGWQWTFWSGAVVLAAVWIVFFALQRDKPEDVGLTLQDDDEPVVQAGASADDDAKLPKGALVNVLLVGSFYFFVKFVRYALLSWSPFFLERNFGLKGDDANYVSTTFEVAGVLGVIFAGLVSDRFFGGRRAGVGLAMMLAMAASCGLLFVVGLSSTTSFAICIGLVGFTLFGPDALLTGAGAMDIGSRRAAVRAAGIINGMGSCGSVVQELVVGRVYDAKAGALGPVLAMLLGAALLACVCIGIVVGRNRAGRSDV